MPWAWSLDIFILKSLRRPLMVFCQLPWQLSPLHPVTYDAQSALVA